MAFLALLVGSDGINLLGIYWFDASRSTYAVDRMQAEIVPTMVHIFGLVLFVMGLAAVNPRISPIQRKLTEGDKHNLEVAGWVLATAGLAMKILAMYLWGVGSLLDYLDQLYDYDTSTRTFGFLDQGVAVTAFGMVLLTIRYEGRRGLQGALLMTSIVVSMFLSTGKSGLFHVAIPFYLIASALSRQTLKVWTRLPVLVVVGVLFIAGLGIKTDVKYSGLAKVDVTPDHLVYVAWLTVSQRLSESGLYRGYSNLVNRIIEDPSLQLNFEVASGIVTGVVPRFIWSYVLSREKPDHPFHAKGELVSDDYNVDPFGNDAPTFVGSAFSDAAFWSLVPYMIIGGFMLGIIRKVATASNHHILLLIGYMYFSSRLGMSLAESGFLNIMYDAIGAVFLMVFIWAVIEIRTIGGGSKRFLTNSHQKC
jgi:hypothetical protein